MKLWVIIDDTNGAFEEVAYRTETEAKVRVWDAIKDGLLTASDLDYVFIQKVEVTE